MKIRKNCSRSATMDLPACRTSPIFRTARTCTSYCPSASGTKSNKSKLIRHSRSQGELMPAENEILEANKKTVVGFYQRALFDGDVDTAIRLYGGKTYT